MFLFGCKEDAPVVPTPVPTPTEIAQIAPLQVCASGVKFCIDGHEVQIRGYSDYGAFSIPFDYEKSFVVYKENGINFSRQWAIPVPTTWGGLQPYTFANDAISYNEPYWQNADRFIALANKYGIYVMVDLSDHYSVYKDREADGSPVFIANPLNAKNGGPLAKGIPDLYTNVAILHMLEMTAKRLSKYNNVVYQICNEPGGATSVQQLADFHKKAAQILKRVHPSALVGINVIEDKATKRPTVPSAKEVGADFITVHQAGIENVNDANSCTVAVLKQRLLAIQNWNRVPVIADTDALYSTRVPCTRSDNAVVYQIAQAAKTVAGMNQRDDEIALDLDALHAIRGN